MAFVFRVAKDRSSADACSKLMQTCDQLYDQYHGVQVLPPAEAMQVLEPPAYEVTEVDPQGGLLLPGIPEKFPLREVGSGSRLLRNYFLYAIPPEKAIIISTIKSFDGVDRNHYKVDCSFFVAMTAKFQVLILAVIRQEDDTESRRLWPNMRADVQPEFAMKKKQIRQYLAEMLGYDTLLVGWKVEADLAAIGLTLPAIQVVDMAAEEIPRQNIMASTRIAGIEKDLTHLKLPEVFALLPEVAINIRYIDREDIRDPLIDAAAITTLWRFFARAIMDSRQSRLRSFSISLMQTYVGNGPLLEEIPVGELRLGKYRSSPFEIRLPYGIPLTDDQIFPTPLTVDEIIDNIVIISGCGSPRIEDQLAIFDFTRLRNLWDLLDQIAAELTNILTTDFPRWRPHLRAEEEEDTYDWFEFFARGNRRDLADAIAIAEDLPPVIDEWKKGPLGYDRQFTIQFDPFTPDSWTTGAQAAKDLEKDHQDFVQKFDGHFHRKPGSFIISQTANTAPVDLTTSPSNTRQTPVDLTTSPTPDQSVRDQPGESIDLTTSSFLEKSGPQSPSWAADLPFELSSDEEEVAETSRATSVPLEINVSGAEVAELIKVSPPKASQLPPATAPTAVEAAAPPEENKPTILEKT